FGDEVYAIELIKSSRVTQHQHVTIRQQRGKGIARVIAIGEVGAGRPGARVGGNCRRGGIDSGVSGASRRVGAGGKDCTVWTENSGPDLPGRVITILAVVSIRQAAEWGR